MFYQLMQFLSLWKVNVRIHVQDYLLQHKHMAYTHRSSQEPSSMSGNAIDLPSNPHTLELSRHSEPTSMMRRILPSGRTPHVCVVGAGMAGMRCAQILSDKGMKVTVFEGRDRLGGRVGPSKNEQRTPIDQAQMHQSNHLGHWVDLQDFPLGSRRLYI